MEEILNKKVGQTYLFIGFGEIYIFQLETNQLKACMIIYIKLHKC